MTEKAKILVVDDEEAIRRNFKANLEDYDYQVVTASNGVEALQVYDQEHPALVLTDLRMPEMNGMELISALKAKYPSLPVVVVSGTGTIKDAVSAIRRGAWDYMLKPVREGAELDIVVQRTLERARLMEENRQYQGRLESLLIKKTRELTKMELQLIQAERLEAIGTLAGGIAHDFNNILSVILGYTELARDQVKQEPVAIEYLKTAHQAIKRAVDLVSQIRTFSGATEHEPRLIQANHLIKESMKFLRASIPSCIEIKSYITSDAVVQVNPSELNRIVINLCTNAAIAMGEQGGVLDVRLEDTQADASLAAQYPQLASGRLLCLTVQDTGCGMTPDVQAKIFEKFFTTRRDHGGTGMGLHVVQDIVTARGGVIQVESEPGKGSSFRIFLPTVETTVEAMREAAEQPVHGSERILLVDDDKSIIDLLNTMLGWLGYHVHPFVDSRDGLTVFTADSNSFDLLITDLTMPHLTGETLISKVRELRPDMPVLILTGNQDKARGEKVRSLGANEIIFKPVMVSTLSRAIRRALGDIPENGTS